jgi:hypothetical protein
MFAFLFITMLNVLGQINLQYFTAGIPDLTYPRGFGPGL